MGILNIFTYIKSFCVGAIALIGGIFVAKKIEESNEMRQDLKKKTIELDSEQNEIHKIKQDIKINKEMNNDKKEEINIIQKTQNDTNKKINNVNNKIDSLKDGDETKISI